MTLLTIFDAHVHRASDVVERAAPAVENVHGPRTRAVHVVSEEPRENDECGGEQLCGRVLGEPSDEFAPMAHLLHPLPALRAQADAHVAVAVESLKFVAASRLRLIKWHLRPRLALVCVRSWVARTTSEKQNNKNESHDYLLGFAGYRPA